jgi:hypothetical protein
MAVTKIRKITSWLLWLVLGCSIIVFFIYFLGGEAEESTIELKVPKYTDLMLYLDYIVFGAAVFSFILFGLYQFILTFVTKPKSALISLGIIVGFLAFFIICYNLGDATPLVVSEDSEKYNTPFWLKMSDMWIFTLTIMLGACLLACLGFAVKQVVDK